MQHTPLISIVIPTLQEERIITRTLTQFSQALREQFHLEIIVSDGGSTDETLTLAARLADKVVPHIDKERQNISIGRNRGAQAAEGEIIVFINADVLIENVQRFFLEISDTMKNRAVVGATCNVNIYPEEQLVKDWMFHNFYNGYFWFLNLLGMGAGRGECHVVRKEIFERVSGYNPKFAAGEDYDLFLRMQKFGKIKFIRTLTVFESPRRFRKYGYLWISILWFLNAISVLFFHRSLVDHWKTIR
ncbi:MAG: glycosyltransferase [Bacteroidota bacterium]|nr:glycosyltransferase [Bacteroidota bacterium]